MCRKPRIPGTIRPCPGLYRDCSTLYTVKTCTTYCVTGCSRVPMKSLYMNTKVRPLLYFESRSQFSTLRSCLEHRKRRAVSRMIDAVFPFQFISRTPHTCNSSAINIVATKKVMVLYMTTEVRFLLYLGSQWLVCSNKFISCTLNTHIMHGLRLAETGQCLWALSTKTEVRDTPYLISHSWGFLSNTLLALYREHMLHA